MEMLALPHHTGFHVPKHGKDQSAHPSSVPCTGSGSSLFMDWLFPLGVSSVCSARTTAPCRHHQGSHRSLSEGLWRGQRANGFGANLLGSESLSPVVSTSVSDLRIFKGLMYMCTASCSKVSPQHGREETPVCPSDILGPAAQLRLTTGLSAAVARPVPSSPSPRQSTQGPYLPMSGSPRLICQSFPFFFSLLSCCAAEAAPAAAAVQSFSFISLHVLRSARQSRASLKPRTSIIAAGFLPCARVQ